MTTPITTTTEHWRCDCVPNLGPAHCHGCDDESQSPVAWVDCPANRPATPELDRAVAARVTKRLTDAWGWLPGEPEAVTLGTNFARSAYLLVAGTRTTPDNLLDALIDGPTEAAPTVKPGRDEVYAIVRNLVRDKGNVVYEWPDDEAAAYRDRDGFSEGMQAVEDLRAEKGTRAVLAILPGKTIAQVRAEALRDAADLARSYSNGPLDYPGHIAAILDERADEEAGK